MSPSVRQSVAVFSAASLFKRRQQNTACFEFVSAPEQSAFASCSQCTKGKIINRPALHELGQLHGKQTEFGDKLRVCLKLNSTPMHIALLCG